MIEELKTAIDRHHTRQIKAAIQDAGEKIAAAKRAADNYDGRTKRGNSRPIEVQRKITPAEQATRRVKRLAQDAGRDELIRHIEDLEYRLTRL